MSAPRKPAEKPSPRFKLLARRPPRWALGPALAAALVGAGVAGWRLLEPHVASSARYRLAADQIVVPPTPEWVGANEQQIVRAVLESGGLDGQQSLLDEGLAERAAQAFALHPAVKRVNRVVKTAGGGLNVDLDYRHPACMVEVEDGFVLPVDDEGVVLPSEGFTVAAAARFPRLVGVHSHPAGAVGQPWGDRVVEQGAEVAAALSDDWETLRLHVLRAVADDSTAPQFEILTRPDAETGRVTTIIWGLAPTVAEDSQPTAAAKRDRLLKLAAARGRLSTVETDIDLRYPAADALDRAATSEPNAELR